MVDALGFETRAVHAGQPPDPATGAVVTPISLSTTFAQDGVGGHQGFEYSRSGNPTRSALEACIASLEGARHGLAFASGLAAEDNVLRLLSPGDRVLLGSDAYGGTFRLIDKVHTSLRWTALDLLDVDDLAIDWPADTRLVWLETPTNPLLRCVDIEAVAALAHERGALVCVDNTFATPFLQQPLAWGADVVVHSATKYLGGHSDVTGGVIAGDVDLVARVRRTRVDLGGSLGPDDAFLLHRGLATLPLRMARHCATALAVATALLDHPAVERVDHPGLPGHRDHGLAVKLFDEGRYGAVVTITPRGGRQAGVDLCDR